MQPVGTIFHELFGKLHNPDGSNSTTEITRYILKNESEMEVGVLNYGATISSIEVPDYKGHLHDVVLGFDDILGYENHGCYFGCTVGRVANRIAKGKFTLNGRQYSLATNNGPNHLHGGMKGFDKVPWKATVNGSVLTLSHVSCDGDQGYPGQVSVSVSYYLTAENALVIEYKGTSTAPTPINLTNHSYFNLGGHDSGSVLNHKIAVFADNYTPSDDTLIPTGEVTSVTDTPFDLRELVEIGENISRCPGAGYDHNFCVNGEPGVLRPVARVEHADSHRVMEVLSTQPGVQFYTGNFLPTKEALVGKYGGKYIKHSGFCLETQNYPDAINKPNFPNCVLQPGEEYKQTTVYKFSLL